VPRRVGAMGRTPRQLVLLRHGESEWNRENLFTGWWDAGLTDLGEDQARTAGVLMAKRGVLPLLLHTSLQTRAIRTAELALAAMDRSWIDVRRSWRLNERHYGDLTGRNKAETAERFGVDQVQIWRRSYDIAPPPIAPDNPCNPNGDERYAQVPPGDLPLAECLKDVVVRLQPYLEEVLLPDLRTGRPVLVAAHGNSLRALVKQLDGIPDDEIVGLNIPTGEPFVYEVDDDLRPVEQRPHEERYLRGAEEIRAAAEAVAKQAERDPQPEEGNP
jgi:2,3-bisphosphoglycerate-dependent phosphoglycerate mutase